MQSGLEILSWSFWSPETREPAEWRAAQPVSAAQRRRPRFPITQFRHCTAAG